MITKEQIIKKLLAQKLIDSKIVNELEKISKIEDIFDYLSTELLINQELLTKLKADLYGMKYIDLNGLEINKETVNLLPKDLSETYRIVIFDSDGSVIKVGLTNPADFKSREAVEFIARQKGMKVKFYLISENSFDLVVKHYSALKTEVEEALDVAEDKMKQRRIESESEIKEDAQTIVKSAPISKMVEVIVRHGVDMKASDIHIEPFESQTRVRYRIDGVLRTQLLLPKAVHASIISRIKVMSNLKIDETRIPQDGRIRLKIDKQYVDFRISSLPLYDQEKIVMRILDTSGGALTLDQLGFTGRNAEIIKNNIDKPNGMFLVTGPTGSGKSTTLYSVLNILNKEGVNIVTLEDPVEYYLQGVNQSQINPDVGLTFATGLRSILRQDPDIVMVGEIRDSETAELAIHAALTGHFVLSTLHTNDSFGALPRLLDMGVESFLLTSTLNVVIAQRLVRKICEKCKEEYELPLKLANSVFDDFQKIDKKNLEAEGITVDTKEKIKFFHGRGCKHCDNSGYDGRLAIVEVLDMSNDLREQIASGKSLEKIRQDIIGTRTLTLQQDGFIKAFKGLTTIEEIIRATKE
ncbi:MAG: GspE/PulE family protein [Patescibacteria group bacterium]